MKLTKREKILLPSVLIIILSAMFINFVYVPLYQTNQNLSTQSKDLASQILELQTKQEEVEALKQKRDDISKQITADYTDIPGIWDQAVLLAMVESMMDDLSKQKSIDFYDVTYTDVLQAGVVTVVFNTNYNNFQKILRNYEASEYFNSITNLSIKKLASGSEETADTKNDLEVSMDVSFYATTMLSDFPSEYDFMNGKFGKTNIFE